MRSFFYLVIVEEIFPRRNNCHTNDTNDNKQAHRQVSEVRHKNCKEDLEVKVSENIADTEVPDNRAGK